MKWNKKSKLVLLYSVTASIAVVGATIPLILHLASKNNSEELQINNINNSRYSLGKYNGKYERPIRPKTLNGMAFDSQKYNELVLQRKHSYKKTLEKDYMMTTMWTYEWDEVIVNVHSDALPLLKELFTDDEIDDIVVSSISELNLGVGSLYSKYTGVDRYTIDFGGHVLRSDNGGWGLTDDRETISKIQIEDILLSTHKDKELARDIIKSIVLHEFGHYSHNFLSNSRSSVMWNKNFDYRFKDNDATNFLKSGQFNAFTNVLYSLNLSKVYSRIIQMMRKGTRQNFSFNTGPISYIVSRYYNHPPNIDSNFFLGLNWIGIRRYFGEHTTFGFSNYLEELFAYLQEGYGLKISTLNDFLIPEHHNIYTSFISRIRGVAYEFGFDPWPYDTYFPAKFMSVFLKYFNGIGDMNTLQISSHYNLDRVWFGSMSTELGKKLKKIRLVYPEKSYELPILEKDYPIGWNFQPITIGEKYYKYVSEAKYGFMEIPYHSSKPQQIIFLDENNQQLSNQNVQLIKDEQNFERTGQRQRYIFDNQTQTWEENYENT